MFKEDIVKITITCLGYLVKDCSIFQLLSLRLTQTRKAVGKISPRVFICTDVPMAVSLLA